MYPLRTATKAAAYRVVSALPYSAHARQVRALRARTEALYRGFIQPGDLCFDIGANVGDRTAALAALGAHVIAVEPQDSCVRTLRRRFARQSLVQVVPMAVGEQEGTADLAICDAAPTLSTLSRQMQTESRFAGTYAWTRTQRVSVTTLDALIARYGRPAFCKIDVEGFELSVLRGLSAPLNLLSFEFMRELLHDTRACVDYLDSLGPTSFNYACGESHVLAQETWCDEAALFEALGRDTMPDLWGDIYAHARSFPTALGNTVEAGT